MIYKNEADLILRENNFKINHLGGNAGVKMIINLLPGCDRNIPHGPRIKVIYKGTCAGYFEIRQNTGKVVYDKKSSNIPANNLAEVSEIIEDIAYGCYKIITAYFYYGAYANELTEAIDRIGSAKRVDRKILSKEYRERFKNVVYAK